MKKLNIPLKSIFNYLVNSTKLYEQNVLSISNLLVLAILTKLLISTQIDGYILGALFISLINYNVKKWFKLKEKERAEESDKRLNRLEEEVKALISASELRKLGR